MAKLRDVGYGGSRESLFQLTKRHIGIYWYMANTLWAWFYHGGRIRREYKKCIAENSVYIIDKISSDD
jgi:hypothetical protein